MKIGKKLKNIDGKNENQGENWQNQNPDKIDKWILNILENKIHFQKLQKYVKVCLHYSLTVQISQQFDKKID